MRSRVYLRRGNNGELDASVGDNGIDEDGRNKKPGKHQRLVRHAILTLSFLVAGVFFSCTMGLTCGVQSPGVGQRQSVRGTTARKVEAVSVDSNKADKQAAESSQQKGNAQSSQGKQHTAGDILAISHLSDVPPGKAHAAGDLKVKTSISRGNSVMMFLHIGKAGGTSFDSIGNRIAQAAGMQYKGRQHFDWNLVEKYKKTKKVEVVTILREPVDRAISHYHFIQTLSFTRNTRMRTQTMDDFLFNSTKQEFLDHRDFWQDGQAAVSWLTGTHIANWVGCPRDQVETREKIAQNATAMMELSADRLDETLWFALLEDMDRSMVLLQRTLNVTEELKMPVANKNKKNDKKVNVSANAKHALRSLMPQDMWLYEYAKSLFEARWQHYIEGQPLHIPPRPPLPKQLPCVSTRFTLSCQSGPLTHL